MRYLKIFSATFLFAVVGCSDNSGDRARPQASSGPEWYSGGTLQQATLSEWRSGSSRDRLASSADFAAVAARQQNMNLRSMDELRPIAVNLERCISATGRDGAADSMRVSEVAAACILLQSQ